MLAIVLADRRIIMDLFRVLLNVLVDNAGACERTMKEDDEVDVEN